MLTLGECRRIVGELVQISDADLLKLQEQLRALAHVSITVLDSKNDTPTFTSFATLLRSEMSDELQERAGIMEFDGGLSRRDAEGAALVDVPRGKRTRLA